MKGKESINTPFKNTIAESVPGRENRTAVNGHNKAPDFSKPQSMGKDTIPTKFYEAGKYASPDKEKFETPFNNTLYAAGSKKQGMNSGPLDKKG